MIENGDANGAPEQLNVAEVTDDNISALLEVNCTTLSVYIAPP